MRSLMPVSIKHLLPDDLVIDRFYAEKVRVLDLQPKFEFFSDNYRTFFVHMKSGELQAKRYEFY